MNMNAADPAGVSALLEFRLLDLFAPRSRDRTGTRSGAAPHSHRPQEAVHRAKNLAQLSLSFANLVTHPSVNWPSAEAAAPARDLAATYGKLFSDDIEPVVPCLGMLEDVATLLVEMFGRARCIVLEVAGNEVFLPSEIRRALVLIASELVVNALKYAFSETGPGRILVTLRSEAKQTELIVADNGAGAIGPRLDGLGQGLVDRLAAISEMTVLRTPSEDGGYRVCIKAGSASSLQENMEAMMTGKQPTQAVKGRAKKALRSVENTAGAGESGGGAYPNPHTGRKATFDGGQSDKSYEGPENPNATTK